MSTVPSTQAKLLTAEEFALIAEEDQPMELVSGRILYMTRPGFRHGWVCARIAQLLANHLDQHNVGFVISNDSGVITERNPDSVRGPDVAFFSYQRLPKDDIPKGWPKVLPELVFEVKSPEDRWKNIVRKAGEYLEAGVLMVCVLDPETRIAHIYRPDQPTQMLQADGELVFPDWLADYRVPVKRFFEMG